MSKRHNVIFKISDTEKEQLNNMLVKFGCTTSEFMRQLIRDRYLKLFPDYILKKKDRSKKNEYFESLEKETPERLCEIWGGPDKLTQVGMERGVMKCRKQYSKSKISWKPLSKDFLINAIKSDHEDGLLKDLF